MNILLITKNLPYPLDQGGNIRNYYLLKHLSRYHTLFLVSIVRSSKEASYVKYVQPFCERVECILLERTARLKVRDLARSILFSLPYTVLANSDAKVSSAIYRAIEECRIEVVQAQELYVAANIDFTLCNRPVVLDAFNRESAILRRMAGASTNPAKRLFYRLQMRKMDDFERRVVTHAAAVFAVSEVEKSYFSRINPRVFLLPNGAEEVRRRTQPREPRLLFTGLLKYPPNRDALLFFLRHIWPRIWSEVPAAVLDIVARDPGRILLRSKNDRTRFHTAVDDMTPFLQQARVMVVPLRAGGGTRLKILQAFAAGIPVVSTSIGAEGLNVEDAWHMLLRDTAPSFAQAVVQVLRHDAVAEKLADAAATLVEQQYLWKSIVADCAHVYSSIGNGQP